MPSEGETVRDQKKNDSFGRKLNIDRFSINQSKLNVALRATSSRRLLSNLSQSFPENSSFMLLDLTISFRKGCNEKSEGIFWKENEVKRLFQKTQYQGFGTFSNERWLPKHDCEKNEISKNITLIVGPCFFGRNKS